MREVHGSISFVLFVCLFLFFVVFSFNSCGQHLYDDDCISGYHNLIGLGVKASTLGVEDLGFSSHLRRGDFSRMSRTTGLKISTPVATLPGA